MGMALLAVAALTMSVQDPSASSLAPAQRQAIGDVLFIAGLAERDLRAHPAPTQGSALLLAAHSDPVRFAVDSPARTLRHVRIPAFSALGVVREEFRGRPPALPLSSPSTPVDLPEEVPASVRDPLRSLIQAMLRSNEEVLGALSALTSEEKRTLIEGLPRRVVPVSALPLSFVRGPTAPWEDQARLLAKVDLIRIQNAAEWLQRESDRLVRSLKSASTDSFRTKLRFTAGGIRVVLAGVADDLHDETDAVLTIDLGGNDRYTGRHGAGIGYTSIAVDLGGSDVYDLPDASLGLGLLGIGLAYDLGGADTIRGNSLCMGAGVGGVGVFRAGPDAFPLGDGPTSNFDSTAMSQGFGFYGTGVMIRNGGNDVFRAQYLSQGAGLESGVGWLISRGGADTFLSTGLPPSVESDAILRSRSQGFGGRIGRDRSEIGGIGICLVDSISECHLKSGTESQGCGQDDGLGIAILTAPVTTVQVAGYGQGFGARRGVGIAWCEGETTQYLCQGGAAQGMAQDAGIGVLIDADGNDLYVSETGWPGHGRTGGVGLLLDFGGNDRFFGSGSTAAFLETAGMGLRVDLTGSSVETQAFPGPRFEVHGVWGLVGQIEGRQEIPIPVDLNLDAAIPPNTSEKIETALRVASGLEPFAARRPRAQAFKDLASGPGAVLDWALTLTREFERIELSVLGEVLRAAPSEFRRRCAQVVSAADPALARRALRIAAAAEYPEAAEPALAALARDEVATEAARTLAALNHVAATEELLPRCASNDLEIRRSAAMAIARLGGPTAASTAQALLGDIDPLVRRAAIETLGRLKLENLDPLKTLARTGDEIAVRSIVAALGIIGTPEALTTVGGMLEDRRPGVRAEALLALKNRLPEPFRPRIDAMRNDPDLRVRALALWFNPAG